MHARAMHRGQIGERFKLLQENVSESSADFAVGASVSVCWEGATIGGTCLQD